MAGDGLTRIAENLVAGVSNGSIWALVAIGYTLVYGIIELINFAHGDVFMIGSFVAFGLYGTFGLTLATGTLGLAVGLLAILLICMVTTRRAQRDDRAGGLPAVTRRAQAGAADHRGRHVVHPPERRHPLGRRLAEGHPRPDRRPEATLRRSPA